MTENILLYEVGCGIEFLKDEKAGWDSRFVHEHHEGPCFLHTIEKEVKSC